MTNVGGEWIAEAPEGKVKVRVTERNELGVLDHPRCPKGRPSARARAGGWPWAVGAILGGFYLVGTAP